VRQTRCRSLPASVCVVGCQTPWKAARVRSSSLWVPSGRFDRASDSPCTTSRAPSETDRQLPSALRVRPLTRVRGLDHGWWETGRYVVVRFRSSSVSLRHDRCWRQRRWWSSASRELSRVSVVSESVSAQVSGDRRKVVVGRQLFARSRDDEGDLRVAGVARGSRWRVSWLAIRGTGGAEVVTPSCSSTG
jgi:hypothetical protein